MIDGKLNTLHSSGELEAGADDVESRSNFISKFQKVKADVQLGSRVSNIFSRPDRIRKIDSGNWKISSFKSGQLIIKNVECIEHQVLIKSDIPGFTFEFGNEKLQSFNAESTLGFFKFDLLLYNIFKI